MDNSLSAKQQFLSQEILDKGYNSNSFLEFLKGIKANGDNLSNWSMCELRQYVTEFQLRSTKHRVFSQEKPHITASRTASALRGSQIPLPKQQSLMQSTIVSQIKCLPHDNTDLTELTNMRLILSFPEKKKESSGLSKRFIISFLIEIRPINIKVRRHLDDFFWLRSIMKKLFPGVFIPPINNKAIDESTKDKVIEKRMINYEKFLNMLANDELLRSSRIFFDFISTQKETEFQLKMKAYDKMPAPRSISQIHSMNGVIQLNNDIVNHEGFWIKTSDSIQSNINLLKKLNHTYKLLLNDLNQVSTRFNELSLLYNEIATVSTKSTSPSMKSYSNMKSIMLDMSYFFKKQSLIFDLEVNQHIKYLIKQYGIFKELKDDFIERKAEVDKSKDRLDRKKEALFKKKDIKKWELKPEDTNIDPYNKELAYEKMLPEETQELIESKRYCYYLGSSFEADLKRIEGLIESQNNAILIQVSKKTGIILKELGESLKTPGV